jgi:lysophospholipase L1-like esterase
MIDLRKPAAALLLGMVLIGAAPVTHWVGTWATSQQVPEDRNTLPDADLTDTTLRQSLRVSIGGDRIRVLVTNAFGTQPLVIAATHVAPTAAPGSAQIDPAGDRKLTFDGQDSVTIPAGASWWSDPIAMPVKPLQRLTVTLYLPAPPKGQTSHPGSRTTSYLARGNHVADADLPGAKPIEHWYQLAGLSVAAPSAGRAIVTFGDSITDGHGATTNGDDRWPDAFAERLRANPATRDIGVLNHGIGGNRLLLDGLGPNALARFDRDVLAQPGARYLIVLEGINDLGTLTRDKPTTPEAHADLVRHMIAAYAQMIDRAHARDIKVIGATILPDGASSYYHPDALNEADRQTVNAWIRAPGHFDAVADFDAATRDPTDPRKMRKDMDSGDGLHPNPAGYRAMAAAVPLGVFRN